MHRRRIPPAGGTRGYRVFDHHRLGRRGSRHRHRAGRHELHSILGGCLPAHHRHRCLQRSALGAARRRRQRTFGQSPEGAAAVCPASLAATEPQARLRPLGSGPWGPGLGPNSSSNGTMAALGVRGIDAQWSAMMNLTQGDWATRRTHVVAAVGFLVAMVDGYDTLMLAFIAPLISKEWALGPQTVGAIFASSYAGAALGATVIGIAADRFGRKTMLIVSLALIGVFTMLCARSGSAAQLMVLRAIAGLGLGGALSATTAITAAHAPPQQRRAIVTRMFLGFPVGAIVGGAVTAAVMSSLGWRGVFLGGGICALLLIPLVMLSIGETAGDARKGTRVHSPRPVTELLSAGRGRSTALFLACVFLMLLTSYFLVSWIPTVLTLNGMAPRHAALAAVVLNCGGIAGTLILSFIFGRRSPLAP